VFLFFKWGGSFFSNLDGTAVVFDDERVG